MKDPATDATLFLLTTESGLLLVNDHTAAHHHGDLFVERSQKPHVTATIHSSATSHLPEGIRRAQYALSLYDQDGRQLDLARGTVSIER